MGDAETSSPYVVPLRRIPREDPVDAELIERARTGDIAAYDDLMRRYQSLAYRTAGMIAGASDAEDVVQEAFVKVFHHLADFRPGAAFRPWLLTIVANEARNRRRAGNRYLAAVRRAAGQRQLEPFAADERVSGLERRHKLLHAIRALPERDRLVVHCRYLLELSEAETAATLGIRAGTVKSRLARAIGRLRELLPDATGPES
jgi:RNA polymerase sigma-70 factor (ECF subfamily)